MAGSSPAKGGKVRFNVKDGVTSEAVPVRGAELMVFRLDGDSVPVSARGSAPDSAAGPVELIWAHGWGQTHEVLLPLAQAMRHAARSILIDFPGFGASPCRQRRGARPITPMRWRNGSPASRRRGASGSPIRSAAGSGCNSRRATPRGSPASF